MEERIIKKLRYDLDSSLMYNWPSQWSGDVVVLYVVGKQFLDFVYHDCADMRDWKRFNALFT